MASPKLELWVAECETSGLGEETDERIGSKIKVSEQAIHQCTGLLLTKVPVGDTELPIDLDDEPDKPRPMQSLLASPHLMGVCLPAKSDACGSSMMLTLRSLMFGTGACLALASWRRACRSTFGGPWLLPKTAWTRLVRSASSQLTVMMRTVNIMASKSVVGATCTLAGMQMKTSA